MGMQTNEPAFDRIIPGAGTAFVAGNGAAGTGLDISAFRGKWVTIVMPGKTYIRGATTAALSQAVVATDIYLTADVPQDFYVPEDGSKNFICGWGVGAAHAGSIVQSSR